MNEVVEILYINIIVLSKNTNNSLEKYFTPKLETRGQ